ncbi:ribosome maturation factor RimP [Halanaerobium congolense]|uniref:Ribosome maturation factor RimP n=1 Tax=Halanaerobium congolense TaxID=54121 RepID=A0A1G6I739_9FIRM|nr:ribosome maturation factor RimP [Halanaerobium congolense]TDS33684.1 ribosome maturation factor RimP [Halanaerobium congolense]SDC02271.1 ribosome maturation factor RimP [Halanaerobium congolense]SDG81997.1 ribosome maturation factor RimP [Halanaerobium congolense]SHM19592.1 ribosome maturation factor RimP [Halanaerobium congolense]
MFYLGKVADTVTDFVLPIAHNENLTLIDVEFLKEGSDWVLRIFLENKNGDLTIEECEKVSRSLSIILDEEDPIDKSYILEVSSPGIERPLKTEEDFERFQGELIAVKTFKKIDGEKEFIGSLKEFKNEKITLILKNNEEITIDYNLVARANLTFEI